MGLKGVIAVGVMVVLGFAASARAEEASHTIFIMSNGWHTNIVLARRDIPEGEIPEIVDVPGATYVEFGWGDADYYPAEQTTIGMTLRAAFTPTLAVLHMVGAARHPADRYPGAEVVSLRLGTAGMRRLVEFIDSRFDRGGAARVKATQPGLYANSWFYPAVGRFHLGNTCNTWTARALDAAGLDVDPSKAARAEDIMRQVRGLAAPG